MTALATVWFTLVAVHHVAAAELDPAIASALGLPSDPLENTTTQIIQYVLGLLGLVAVIMIIVGGFRWMTAGGNDDSVDKAKKIISAAVIGLAIVLLAWAIVVFIGQTLINAPTTPNPDGFPG